MLYLVAGEERALIKQKNRQIKRDFLKKLNESEYESVIFDLKENKIEELFSNLEQCSLMFFTKKFLLIENADFLFLTTLFNKLGKNNIDNLIKIFKDLKDDQNVLLLFTSEKEKILNNEAVKNFYSKNIFIYPKMRKDRWLDVALKYIENKNYSINFSDLKLLATKCNYDFEIFINEIEKLFLYVEDKNIQAKDIEEVVSTNVEDKIFDMSSYILKKDVKNALALYQNLKLLNYEPISLIAFLTTNLIFAEQVLYLKNKGNDINSIASILGSNYYRAKMILEDNATQNDIKLILSKLYELDKNIKLGNVDRFFGFELFLATIVEDK